VGLGGLGLAILAAPAVSAAGTPTCDWTDTNSSVTVTAAQGQSPPPVLQAAVGDPITITAGNLGSDPNATCPPTQAQVDAGLTNCALAVATAAAAQESVVLVNYSAGATNPTPTAPSLAITNGSHGFVGGNTVNVADGPSGKWWSTLTTGAPNAGLGIPNPAVVIDAASATPRPAASAVTIAPATYVNGNCHGSPIANCGGVGGTLTPPVLGGSFTWPGSPELSAGSHTVTLFALDLAPAGTVGSTLGSPCPPSPVPCVNASALANEQAASALVGGSFSPASGVGSAGNTLQFDVSPVDAQGSVLCEARFTNGATVNPYAGTCQNFGTNTGSSSGQSTGTLHVTLPITAADNPGANTIYLVIDGSPVLLTLPYTISSLATTCGPIGGGAPGCETDQIINQNVLGTALGLSQTETATGTGAPPNVFLSDITLNGFQQTATGSLNTDVVQDIRGTLVGWTVTAVFQDDLLNATPHGNHNTIPVSGFNWTPAVSLNVASPPSGFLADVVAGAATSAGFDKSVASGGTGTARTLCSAAPGGGGGTFNCAAALTLKVPAGVAAGAYSAVLQITIT
jgi:hypothetical protein